MRPGGVGASLLAHAAALAAAFAWPSQEARFPAVADDFVVVELIVASETPAPNPAVADAVPLEPASGPPPPAVAQPLPPLARVRATPPRKPAPPATKRADTMEGGGTRERAEEEGKRAPEPVAPVSDGFDDGAGIMMVKPAPQPVAALEPQGGPPSPRPGMTSRPAGVEAGNAPPRYPAAARRRGQEGRVVLLVEVGADGGAGGVAVDRSSGFSLLDAAAVAAVRRWRFTPALSDGVPVAGRIAVPVIFALRGP